MKNNAVGISWEELEKELFTPEEIAASDLRIALMNELIKAREGKRQETILKSFTFLAEEIQKSKG